MQEASEAMMRAAAAMQPAIQGITHAFRKMARWAPSPQYGQYFNKQIARDTVRAISDITAGVNPIKVASEALQDWPGPIGRQIAQDAIRSWLRLNEEQVRGRRGAR
jgi:hypothetical protein